MSCCEHHGYDGEPFHEYCCTCYTFDERVEAIIRDVLANDWRGEGVLPDDKPEAIRMALEIEGVL